MVSNNTYISRSKNDSVIQNNNINTFKQTNIFK